ncbi:MAG: hypothetical protein ACI9WS_003240 [Paraglaciecola psychrophila]|jgi:hypothetical protein
MEQLPAASAAKLCAALAAALAKPRGQQLVVAAKVHTFGGEFSRTFKSLLEKPSEVKREPSPEPAYTFNPCSLLVPRKYAVPPTERQRRRQPQREK